MDRCIPYLKTCEFLAHVTRANRRTAVTGSTAHGVASVPGNAIRAPNLPFMEQQQTTTTSSTVRCTNSFSDLAELREPVAYDIQATLPEAALTILQYLCGMKSSW